MLLADGLAEVSIRTLAAASNHWLRPQRFYRRLSRLVADGYIERIAPDIGGVIRLTTAGRIAALGGRDPEACWRRQWDGRWRVIVFDVPEAEKKRRDRLRDALRRLHFGYLQNSVWITPERIDGLNTAAVGNNIDVETLSFLEARPCAGETDADIVLGAWDWAQINRRYDAYRAVLKRRPEPTASRVVWRHWLRSEWSAWCRAVQMDPLLPSALLPTLYRGRAALASRNEMLGRHSSR